MNQVFLLLGGNLGDRQLHIQKTIQALMDHGLTIVQTSGLYESSPWGVQHQPDYMNQVIEVQTTLYPFGLLKILKEIELDMGRSTKGDMAPRSMDIDILFFNNWQLQTKDLMIPHPKLHLRRFTLLPMAEIAPDLIHPDFHLSIHQLLDICPDTGKVVFCSTYTNAV